jgi:hypothetical protein
VIPCSAFAQRGVFFFYSDAWQRLHGSFEAVGYCIIIQQQFRLLQAPLSLRPFADRFGLLAALAPFRIRQPFGFITIVS